MKTKAHAQSTVLKSRSVSTQNWYAWINKMPPPPDTLHVRGEVVVSNPGVEVALYKRQPQGINPAIIMLDLLLIQSPGVWPEVVTVKSVAYEEVGRSLKYTTAEVMNQSQSVASVPIEVVQ